MKTKPLPAPVPVRAVMPMGGWQSCLPPARARPPKPKAGPLDNLSDAELLKLGEIVGLLEGHDWTYEYSDDGQVYRRGMRQRKAIDEALAALPFDQAEAVWALYAPASMGAYRRFR